MSDTMKALADRLEAHLEKLANTPSALSMMDYDPIANDILLAARTLRAALTPPADDEVEAIRARSDAWDYALHWHSDEGDEIAAKQLDQPRTRPDMTDFQVANWVFLCSREDLRLIAAQTLAKERIRWLSAQLAKSQVDTTRLLRALDAERQRRVEVEHVKAVIDEALTMACDERDEAYSQFDKLKDAAGPFTWYLSSSVFDDRPDDHVPQTTEDVGRRMPRLGDYRRLRAATLTKD